jgi:limonene-1,2-epoxide hydrolase
MDRGQRGPHAVRSRYQAVAVAAPPADASNADRIRWEFEMLNHHDVSPLKQHLWTAETVARFPDTTTRGAEELAAYFDGQFGALTGWHMDVVAVAGQGDDVFLHWRLTGTTAGVQPTGKPITVEGVDHFVLSDGRVVSVYVATDAMEFARHFGMMPSDGSAADKALGAVFNTKTRLVQRVRR